MADVPWRIRGGALLLLVRLTPKSSRDEISGVACLGEGKAVLKVRVRAAPEAGKANDALARLVAKALRIPTGSVSIESGAASRMKSLRLEGDPAGLAARLTRLCARADGGADG